MGAAVTRTGVVAASVIGGPLYTIPHSLSLLWILTNAFAIAVTGTIRRTTTADGGTAEMGMDVDAAFIDALMITALIIYSNRNLPS